MKPELVACYVTGGVAVTALAAHLVHQKVWFAMQPEVKSMDIYRVTVKAADEGLLPIGQERFTPKD